MPILARSSFCTLGHMSKIVLQNVTKEFSDPVLTKDFIHGSPKSKIQKIANYCRTDL